MACSFSLITMMALMILTLANFCLVTTSAFITYPSTIEKRKYNQHIKAHPSNQLFHTRGKEGEGEKKRHELLDGNCAQRRRVLEQTLGALALTTFALPSTATASTKTTPVTTETTTMTGATSPVTVSLTTNTIAVEEGKYTPFQRQTTTPDKKGMISYSINIPDTASSNDLKQTTKPVKTHLDEINFVSPTIKGYQFGITVDPVRINSIQEVRACSVFFLQTTFGIVFLVPCHPDV